MLNVIDLDGSERFIDVDRITRMEAFEARGTSISTSNGRIVHTAESAASLRLRIDMLLRERIVD